MLYFVELLCRGFAHEQVNAAFIYSFFNIQNQDCSFFAEKTHFESVSKRLEPYFINTPQKLHHKQVNVRSHRTDFGWWISNGPKIFHILREINKSKKKKATFLSIDSTQLMWIRFFLIFFREVQLSIVVHGILDELNEKPSFRPWKFPFWFGFHFLPFRDKSIHYLFISPHIEPILKKKYPRLRKNIISLYHPYLWEKSSEHSLNSKEPQICTIGTMTKKKGRDNLPLVLDKLESLDAFHYTSFGRSELKYNKDHFTLIENRFERSFLEVKLQQMDYILLPFKSTAYQFQVSGVFFDALCYNKPVLTLNCVFADYYFSTFGNIGFLADNPNDLVELLKGRITDSDFYGQQVEQIMKAKEYMNQYNKKQLLSIVAEEYSNL